MVHVMPSSSSGRGAPFFYNIDEHVGTGRANFPEDVEFVRFGYFALREAKSAKSAQARADLAAELAGLRPSGGFDTDLEAVIRAHERVRGGTQDGCVSPMRGYLSANHGTYDHKHSWIMVILNNWMIDLLGDRYPRLDAHGSCGPLLRSRMQAMFAR